MEENDSGLVPKILYFNQRPAMRSKRNPESPINMAKGTVWEDLGATEGTDEEDTPIPR